VSTDHRAEAERHLSQGSMVGSPEKPHPVDPIASDFHLRMAQVHATLARDEEQAATTRNLVSAHIAKGLASREPDRWKAALELTKALDEADCNMDDLVDARLADDGWDPRSAYKTPAALAPAGGWIVASKRDPWSKAPDITAQVPEPVRRVLSDLLAAALLNEGDAQNVARSITFALKSEGADLTGDIEKRITELTLGRDPAEPPF